MNDRGQGVTYLAGLEVDDLAHAAHAGVSIKSSLAGDEVTQITGQTDLALRTGCSQIDNHNVVPKGRKRKLKHDTDLCNLRLSCAQQIKC